VVVSIEKIRAFQERPDEEKRMLSRGSRRAVSPVVGCGFAAGSFRIATEASRGEDRMFFILSGGDRRDENPSGGRRRPRGRQSWDMHRRAAAIRLVKDDCQTFTDMKA